MYRPRRTSEFHEDARENGAMPNKRQTRTQLRTTTTPMKKQLKASSRGSQLSLDRDRDRGTPLRTGAAAKRSMVNGSVNNMTPLRPRGASSVERSVPLHTDKKWVQEQAQQIAEYLHEMVQMNALQGFNGDYFSRGGAALRQMTMKQFVGIVSFLLQCIWRNRVSVGSNHVEYITSALHKLKYPYQVNKSWLMTPTTQHSFGHVILMLDFLMDFAPPAPSVKQQQQTEDQYEEFQFMECANSEEKQAQPSHIFDYTALSSSHVSSELLTEQTNHLLFTNAGNSFGLWDTEEWQEYEALKRTVSNRIIKSLCELPDIEALDAELAVQLNQLQQLDGQLESLGASQIEQLQQLKEEQQKLEQQLLSTQTNLEEHSEQTEKLSDRLGHNAQRLKSERKNQQQLQRQVDAQKVMVEKFHRRKLLLNDLKNEEQVHQRQLRDLSERSDHQQVQLSRSKQQLLNLVEAFNKHAQNIGLDSDICSASEKEQLELILPLPPQQSDIQARSRTLKQLAPLLQQRGAAQEERRRQLELHQQELLQQNRKLEAELNALNEKTQTLEQELTQLPQSHQLNCSMWSQHQQQLTEANCKLTEQQAHLQRQQEELAQLLHDKKQEHDDLLTSTEQSHAQRLHERRVYLKEFNDRLTEAFQDMEPLDVHIASFENNMAELRLQLERVKLPPLEEELNAMFESANFN